jgi:hypothetical protein
MGIGGPAFSNDGGAALVTWKSGFSASSMGVSSPSSSIVPCGVVAVVCLEEKRDKHEERRKKRERSESRVCVCVSKTRTNGRKGQEAESQSYKEGERGETEESLHTDQTIDK